MAPVASNAIPRLLLSEVGVQFPGLFSSDTFENRYRRR